ncbi:MAG TPA: TonB-dependent receptor, partial [Gemmatimonadales bacterium]|nr:TonB-dependent receptor [Gemmatimonadales bacterium]
GINSRLELSHDYAHSRPALLTFDPSFGCRFPGSFCLSSASFSLPVTTQATRLEWHASPGTRFANELLVARQRSHWSCQPGVTTFPDIAVQADQGELIAGAADFCVGESTTEHLIELTDNLTITAGNHRITAGTHDELIRLPRTDPLGFQFHNRWHFASLDSLEQGLADIYTATFRNPARGAGPLSDLRGGQVGFYLQDQWTPIPSLLLTAGLRLDVPTLSTRPLANPALQSALGFDNARTPSGYRIWSPRIGVNFDAGGDGSTILRGGAGLFAGRPAYKWFDAVYSHTGLDAIHLECTGANVPPFTTALTDQPTHCGSPATPVVPYVDLFDPGFRFPRTLKLALGVDRRLGRGVVGTVDLLFTKGVDQFFLSDVNLLGPQTLATGEGDRVMYGTIDGFGSATPARRAAGFGPVFRITNTRGDRALSVTGQLQKRFANGTEIGLSYTHSTSRDRFSAVADASDDDFGQVPVDGTLENRNLAPSAWSVPHRVSFVATANLPRGFRLALFYLGVSGHPYTYVVAGDANADGAGNPFDFGFRSNDIVYVPRDAGDIRLAVPDPSGVLTPAPASAYGQLNELIASQRCLREARGRIASRNSCRNPWTNQTSARLSRVFPTRRGQALELIMDVFNLLRLVGSDWGVLREAGGGGSEVALLQLLGYEPGLGRGVYQLLPVDR